MEIARGARKESNVGKVCWLLKGLYGLKQAGHGWHQELTKVLIKQLKIEWSKLDHLVFFWKGGDKHTIVVVATDDMVVMSKRLTDVNEFKDQIKTFWEISDMADISWYLSFEVKCDRNARMISINQRRYIESIAERYGLSDAKPVATPVEPGLLLDQHADGGTETTHHIAVPIPYAEAVGSILWAAMVSRPDVMFAISVFTQFTH